MEMSDLNLTTIDFEFVALFVNAALLMGLGLAMAFAKHMGMTVAPAYPCPGAPIRRTGRP